MLKDLVIQGLNAFQTDCLLLCQSHYPTVHNKGMSNHHLGLAFARRMSSQFTHFDHRNYFEAIDSGHGETQPSHFRVSSELGTVWVHSHHLINASKSCRKNILEDINLWQAEYGYSIQPNDLLVVISDHWFSRNKASRELFSWWNESIPDDNHLYIQQGINHSECAASLRTDLERHFDLTPCYIKYSHPLLKPQSKNSVKKYIQLYSIIEWQG
ncbi:hypothetical protein [Vibrio tapetis]|uniref:Uncharacterized protein n=1 Tax=Vibrio tapetis subsp. tapetis TaxID=1671868 RepID=A0A2N8ZN77_9VIBR|nr:hypothetical protein [Vibrio tapetis]SON53371.1 conserved protein of unknown function [Vibrio tapetis subsp. tapetis]